jgi:hypothetical protein
MVVDNVKTCMIRYQPNQVVEITILKVTEQTIHELASVLATGHQRWLIDWKARNDEPLAAIHLPLPLQQSVATFSDFRLACLTKSAPTFEHLRQTVSLLLGDVPLRAKWYNTSLPGNHRTSAHRWLLDDPNADQSHPFSYQFFG